MRCARALGRYLPALIVCACGGSSAEPPLVTPAPVPEPADETEPASEAPGQAQGPAAAAEPSAEEKDALAAIARLTAEPPLAYYLPGDGTALVARGAEVDGAGPRASAVLVQLDGTSETVAIADEQGQRLLAARLAGKPRVELAYTVWPEGKRRLDLRSPKLRVSWTKKGKVEAKVGKKTIPVGQLDPAPTGGSRPAGLFAGPDSRAVLVIVRAPGDAAGEGHAASTEVLRFDLPARAK